MKASIAQPRARGAAKRWPWGFWGRWVAANAFAELIGLGSSALLWIAFLAGLEARLGILTSATVVVVGSTLLEGTAVGVIQWRVLRSALPKLRLAAWWSATAVGVLIAWSLGMIPSTLLSMDSAASSAAPPPAMSDALMYTLAAVMGLVLGPVLGLPQWLVLRRHFAHAGLWIAANAVAWCWGMLVIFMVISFVPAGGITVSTVLIVLGGLALAGAVVGGIHGVVLVKLVKLT